MEQHAIDLRGDKSRWLRFVSALCLVALAGLSYQDVAANEQPAGWKAGVASTVITPDESMWMAGYAARTKPSEGKIHDLYAKVLALEDELILSGTRITNLPAIRGSGGMAEVRYIVRTADHKKVDFEIVSMLAGRVEGTVELQETQ